VSLLRIAIKQRAGSMIRPFLLAGWSGFVIANEAKQSILALWLWIASSQPLLAMTAAQAAASFFGGKRP
jgi:hypothetical protein